MSLTLSGVRYRYAGARSDSLDDVSVTVEAGTVVGVIGANEAGKSTLCLVAAGLAPATIGGRLDGSTTIDGLLTSDAKPHELAQRCGILFQNPVTQLTGTARSVWEEVAFGPRNLGLALGEIVERVTEAIDALGIGGLVERDPQRLSGGEAQLVALAGVLAMRPAYLILDEPTSQLDPFGTRLVGDALSGLVRATGVGLLVVEHKTDLLAAIADDVLVLGGGRTIASGSAHDVLSRPELEDWGVSPPSAVRLERAAALAGVKLAAFSPEGAAGRAIG
jgi:energy-coupling factor transport system ATP-binding protein